MNHPFFSIIIPTLNLRSEIYTLINQINNQSFQNFELIIVAQANHLSINKFKDFSNLVGKVKIFNLLKSNLSAAKNTGILNANGEYIYFIDDDCELADNFLMKAYESITKLRLDILFGSILAKETSDFILKRWPKKNKYNISFPSAVYLTSAVTIFYNARILKCFLFDENYGLSAYFNGNEDVDLIVRIYLSSYKIKTFFEYDLSVKHPIIEANNKYSKSFGSVVAKNFTLVLLLYLLSSIIWNFFRSIFYFFCFNFNKSMINFISILLRINGFFKFFFK